VKVEPAKTFTKFGLNISIAPGLGKAMLIQQALDNGDVFATHSRFDGLFGLAICPNLVKPKRNKSLLHS